MLRDFSQTPKMYCLSASLLGIVSLLSVAVITEAVNPVPYDKYPADAVQLRYAQEAIVKSSYHFTHSYLKVLAEIDRPKFVVSPTGIFLTLSMISYGVAGNLKYTFDYLLSRLPKSSYKIGCQDLVDDFANYRGLNISNGFFVAPRVQLRPQFFDTIKRTFRSTVKKIDFIKRDKANQMISEWCAHQTGDEIKNFMKRVNPGDDACKRFSAMNTVSFSGTWSKKFNNADTQLRTFYSSSGVNKKLPTMSVSGLFRYGDYSEATFVELPFESNSDRAHNMSMFIILPKDITLFKRSIPRILLRRLKKESVLREIYIELPKFKIALASGLTEPFKRMNLSSLFDRDTADFSCGVISPARGAVFNSVIKQFNAIHVTEGGVEAVSTIGCGSGHLREPSQGNTTDRGAGSEADGLQRFIANRQFYAIITPTDKNAINFFTVQFDA
ncbi:serine protease inhibitor 42Dd-like [Venturia canescens]|uniref:serine protease inhibitor 42Dd-like n=1 Tax=Venturia canescens TaxID=32260 RepID=UPI001C9C0F82|nr:serine protease inhibitor 42Dd-like [Venturia canescens]XP_043281693.1 serine protease inhibitor 42Dd-like [Venturia canescens]XP_043281694.1 serine protease inhibitor 42Dd-like [Venturia canescens]XP_043281695.1 serine protease inhibitor 42Dd-like [Venturia canescens]XP_043281696.1 serine protease inhibitor 42Dd-like [Venturia canescens]